MLVLFVQHHRQHISAVQIYLQRLFVTKQFIEILLETGFKDYREMERDFHP
jgi:hypothetical protein